MIGVILAAGKSSRMGKDKAFLKLNGKYFVNIIFKKIIPLTQHLIIVSNEKNYERFKKHFANKAVIIKNTITELGQIYSLKLAVKYIRKRKIKGPVILNLCDQPLIKESTYKKLKEEQRKNRDFLLIPAVKLNKTRIKRGHPVIIPQKYFDLVLKAPYDKGLHWVTHHPEVKVKNIIVKDKNILKDFDTRKEYQNFLKTKSTSLKNQKHKI